MAESLDLTVTSAMHYGWHMLKSNPKLSGSYAFAVFAIPFATGFLLGLTGWTAEQQFSRGDWLLLVCSFAFQWYLSVGISKAALELARNRTVAIASLFPPFIDFFRVIIVSCFLSVIVALGFILFIIPGIYLALMLSQVFWLVIDRKALYIHAFRASAAMTEIPGIKWQIFTIYLVAGLTFGVPSSILRLFDQLPVLIAADIVQGLGGAFIAFIGAGIYEQLLPQIASAAPRR